MRTIYSAMADNRLTCLTELARTEGYTILPSPPEKDAPPCLFLFPPGAGENAVLPVIERAPAKSLVALGRESEALRQKSAEQGLFLFPYLSDERYLASNSRITAEGVLARLITNTPVSLTELCVLIYGYGNCGRAIARLLWLAGVEVWVWSRTRGQILAREDGFNVFHAPALGLGMFDAVIGTVPQPVYPASLLSTMRSGCAFFQVASGTSGIDPDVLEERGVAYHALPGLPGKVAPLTEAEVIWGMIKEHPAMK